MTQRFKIAVLLVAVAVATAWARDVHAGPIFFGLSPNLKAADSPFGGEAFSYQHVDDFGDGLLSTRGVTPSQGVPVGGRFVDSVKGVPGTLTTDAGPVLTGMGFNAPTPDFGSAGLDAHHPSGPSLDLVGLFLIGDDHGKTAEDRFFGAFDDPGISAIRTGTNHGDVKVDHDPPEGPLVIDLAPVAVPEPATMLLLGTGLFALVRRARPRRVR